MKVKIGKHKENRKVDIVIHDYDTFSLDHTLAHIIYPALVHFKLERTKVPGVPLDFLENEETDDHGNHTDAAIERGEARFMEALDKMIWSFREISEDYPGESQFFLKNGKEMKWKKIKSKNKHMGSRLVESGLELDKDGLTEYSNRIQEGLTLFGKHYRTLWW